MIFIQPERSAITHGLCTGVETTIIFTDLHVGPVDVESLNGRVVLISSLRVGLVSFWVPIVHPKAVRTVVVTARYYHSAVYGTTLEA